jgi:methionine aminopeptidase
VKIDLGVHVDGFIAVVAHTILVPPAVGTETPALSEVDIARRNNVINAAYAAAEVAVRTLRPGNTNHQVTHAIKHVADTFNVRPISGTLMHQMKQFVIDGNKMILLREEPDQQKIETCTFESGEVYAIDIAMSSGDGKPRETGARTTVFKRAVEKKYALKNKSSRAFFNDVNKKFPTLPFTIRAFPDENAARLGIRECVIHELLIPYPVLNEKRDDFVAHVKTTVLLLPSGNALPITGLSPFTYFQAVAQPLPPLPELPPSTVAPSTTESSESAAATATTVALVPRPPAPSLTAGVESKLLSSFPIAQTFLYLLQAQQPGSVPAPLVELLSQPTGDKKKKKKNNKKEAATTAEEK